MIYHAPSVAFDLDVPEDLAELEYSPFFLPDNKA
jgi:hypothetical protein